MSAPSCVLVKHLDNLLTSFYQLDDDEEDLIESNVDITKWNLKPYSGTKSENKTLIESNTQNNQNEDIVNLFFSVFTEFKKEVFKALGISKLARELGLM